jgi:thymidylate kinase
MPRAACTIIELFGPPAAGKTTFAKNLAAQLRGSNRPVELILSFRPEETIDHDDDGSAAPPLATLRRLARPAVELLASMRQMSAVPQESPIASELLYLLPPSSCLWSVRLRQYIARLQRAWRLAEQSNATVIVDQGYVQLVCSLVLQTRAPTMNAVEKALTLIPKADRWIFIDAPRQLLRARLEARLRRQGWIERRFELDAEMSLRSIEVLNMLYSTLRRRDARILRIDTAESSPSPDLLRIAVSADATAQATEQQTRPR